MSPRISSSGKSVPSDDDGSVPLDDVRKDHIEEDNGSILISDGQGSIADDKPGIKEKKPRVPFSLVNELKQFPSSAWKVLWDNKIISSLLIFIPFGLVSKPAGWPYGVVFALCMLAILPLAKLIGEATDQLAAHTNQTMGGLLNATFGNSVELIVAVIALKGGYLRVVQTSLLGSILSNLLLVLGTSFLIGGIKRKEQHFNRTASLTSSSLMFMSAMGLLLPAAFFLSNATGPKKDLGEAVLSLSRAAGVLLLITYVAYLTFQLKTHTHLYEESEGGEEEEEPALSIFGGCAFLAIATAITAVLSEWLVDAIDPVVAGGGISETFIGIILLPIIGNAAEHVGALTAAYRNKMDLAVGVAIGSSIQIALFVVPLCVVLGWIIGQPLSLYFEVYETVVLFISVIIAHVIISDGVSTWLEGLMLVFTYVIVGVGFYYHE